MKYKTAELEDTLLDTAVALAEGWVFAGQKDYTRPEHRQSLDYPGETIADWNNKGPHPRLVSPQGQKLYFCGCEGDIFRVPEFSSDWALGGPIIERERLMLSWEDGRPFASIFKPLERATRLFGDTLLQAAMRRFVQEKLGDEVELP